jgi:hypothetical protein
MSSRPIDFTLSSLTYSPPSPSRLPWARIQEDRLFRRRQRREAHEMEGRRLR